MKKRYMYCFMSITAILLGTLFLFCGLILQSGPFTSESSLMLLSIFLIIAGIPAAAFNIKMYHKIYALYHHHTAIIAHWKYPASTFKIIEQLIDEKKNNSIYCAILTTVLAILFCLIYAYSGGTYVLYTGYLFIFICLGLLLITINFIKSYYSQMKNDEVDIIFGEDSIYFLDELYELHRDYHILESVSIYRKDCDYLVLSYNLYDIDEPPSYIISIPIPDEKLELAMHLRTYYNTLIKSQYL